MLYTSILHVTRDEINIHAQNLSQKLQLYACKKVQWQWRSDCAPHMMVVTSFYLNRSGDWGKLNIIIHNVIFSIQIDILVSSNICIQLCNLLLIVCYVTWWLHTDPITCYTASLIWILYWRHRDSGCVIDVIVTLAAWVKMDSTCYIITRW